MTRVTTFILFAILALPTFALAKSFKCNSPSVNPNVARYEVQLSFEPMGLELTKLFKEDDGTWSSTSETLMTETELLKPSRIQWATCETKLTSDAAGISYAWTKDDFATGHLT